MPFLNNLINTVLHHHWILNDLLSLPNSHSWEAHQIFLVLVHAESADAEFVLHVVIVEVVGDIEASVIAECA